MHETLLTEKELREVFVTYKDPLYGFILSRVKNAHDAEDLFSKSFEKFFRYARERSVNRKTLKSFLFKVASNTCNDFFRRRKIVRFISLDNFVSDEGKGSYYEFFEDTKAAHALDNIDKKDLLQKINLFVSELPDKQKETIFETEPGFGECRQNRQFTRMNPRGQ